MSFPASPVNNQTAVVNNITYIYSSTSNAWTRSTTARATVPNVFNDISTQFDGKKSVFFLKTDQSTVTSIVDSKDIEVIINGLKLTPYVTELRYPWFTPYDACNGFRVVTTGNTAQKLVIYSAPSTGQLAAVTQLNTSLSKQKRRYPFSATTIALGD